MIRKTDVESKVFIENWWRVSQGRLSHSTCVYCKSIHGFYSCYRHALCVIRIDRNNIGEGETMSPDHISPILLSRFPFDSCEINMDQSAIEVRRQVMAQLKGRSVDEQTEIDAAKSAITFTATEADRLLDVMRREEFEEAGKILDDSDYPDQSAITSIVLDNPLQTEQSRVKQQVRQCLKEVISDLEYQPTTREQADWKTNNPEAFSHLTQTKHVNNAIRRHLVMTHTHTQKLKIISGLSIKDAHTFRCQMQNRRASAKAQRT